MKYTTIKHILRGHINKGLKTLWTYNETLNEFKCIYKQYDNGLTIYTPKQLLDKLNNAETSNS